MLKKDTFYMQLDSGEVATLEEWRDDYESTDFESWHGNEIEDCDPSQWIKDGHLVPVVWDSIIQRWKE